MPQKLVAWVRTRTVSKCQNDILKYDYRAYLQTVTVPITKAAFIPTLR